MRLSNTTIASGPCDYWRGGRGAPVLLLHGGWAGAEAHWGPVWNDLAERRDVIAIELKGLWTEFDAPTRNYYDHARACAELLAALDVRDVVVIGNSLGASIGWRLALDRPEIVRRLIMVNGFPPRPLPMRAILTRPPLRRLALNSLTTNFYSPQVFRTAFFDPTNIPLDVRANLTSKGPEMAAVMFRLLSSVTENAGPPKTKLDFIWGERDGLPELSLADGRRLCAAYPASRMVTIPGAGHLPQVENPEAFLEALEDILGDDRV
ncbi:alpha/beta hydrolase [Rhizobium sp. FKL33]|uniref:alpha/beta fold hydrolase n=1 Tax=Rhizobium sp. FKL33 TaxID=2562307 RepID=UPI0010C01EA3|nr:alpha/beta hydrolase [Rhizobium sp. FKL33]